jgi:hypothetical protein
MKPVRTRRRRCAGRAGADVILGAVFTVFMVVGAGVICFS